MVVQEKIDAVHVSGFYLLRFLFSLPLNSRFIDNFYNLTFLSFSLIPTGVSNFFLSYSKASVTVFKVNFNHLGPLKNAQRAVYFVLKGPRNVFELQNDSNYRESFMLW